MPPPWAPWASWPLPGAASRRSFDGMEIRRVKVAPVDRPGRFRVELSCDPPPTRLPIQFDLVIAEDDAESAPEPARAPTDEWQRDIEARLERIEHNARVRALIQPWPSEPYHLGRYQGDGVFRSLDAALLEQLLGSEGTASVRIGNGDDHHRHNIEWSCHRGFFRSLRSTIEGSFAGRRGPFRVAVIGCPRLQPNASDEWLVFYVNLPERE